MNIPRTTEEIADLSYAIAQLATVDLSPIAMCHEQREQIRGMLATLISKIETRLKQV